jgi:Zn-dependent protease with chaperone function
MIFVMTSPSAALADNPCPSCSTPVSADPRFVSWCPACEWNVDPSAGTPAAAGARRGRSARRQEARRTADRAIVERLYAEVSGEASSRPWRGGAWFAAMTIAGAVHLTTVVLTAGSVWLLVTGTFLIRFLGVVGLATAVLLRPRLGRFRRDNWSLNRTEAPQLYNIADRVAAELGVPPIDLIRVTPEFNAGYGKIGLRRRGVLTLGLALWEMLTPQERVALLGHEFGHALNGDARRGLWLRSASEALAHWHVLTHPSRTLTTEPDLLITIGHAAATLLLIIPHKLAGLILLLLHRYTLRTGQRAEYLADDLAARVASSAATRSMLEALVLGESVEHLFQRQRALHRQKRSSRVNSRQEDDFDLWQELREYITSIPETERLRRLRVSALHMASVDTTHPPTHLRARLIDARKPQEAAITLQESEITAVETELTAVRARATHAVLTSNY